MNNGGGDPSGNNESPQHIPDEHQQYDGGIDSTPNEHHQLQQQHEQQQQQQYYQEGDIEGEDQHYEGEEEGGSVSKKLVGSRIARKQAEDDVKLLANRIALLKMEEQKVSNRISNSVNIGMEEDRGDKEES